MNNPVFAGADDARAGKPPQHPDNPSYMNGYHIAKAEQAQILQENEKRRVQR